MFRQDFEVEFDFTQSTAQTLINCVSKLPNEQNPDKRKNVKLGESMNDVDMDKLIDLIEMSDQRVNLFIDGIKIKEILERKSDRSQEILKDLRASD